MLPRGHHSRLDRSEGVAESGVGAGGCREGRKPRWRASTVGRGRDVAEGPEADDVGSLGIYHGAAGAHGVGLAGSREAQGGGGRAQARGQGRVRQAGGVRVRGEVRHGQRAWRRAAEGCRRRWRRGRRARRLGRDRQGRRGGRRRLALAGRARIRRVVHAGDGGRGQEEVGSREDRQRGREGGRGRRGRRLGGWAAVQGSSGGWAGRPAAGGRRRLQG
jgi:hypothetical protein